MTLSASPTRVRADTVWPKAPPLLAENIWSGPRPPGKQRYTSQAEHSKDLGQEPGAEAKSLLGQGQSFTAYSLQVNNNISYVNSDTLGVRSHHGVTFKKYSSSVTKNNSFTGQSQRTFKGIQIHTPHPLLLKSPFLIPSPSCPPQTLLYSQCISILPSSFSLSFFSSHYLVEFSLKFSTKLSISFRNLEEVKVGLPNANFL